MKKKILTAAAFVFFTGMLSAQTNVNNLPAEAKNFVDQHFSSASIERVEEEKSWFMWDRNEMYEVYLSNGTRIDFNKEGEVTEISSADGTDIPAEAIPAPLRSYIKENFPNAEITGWEMEDKKQEIELAQGQEIEFDLNGKFLKQD